LSFFVERNIMNRARTVVSAGLAIALGLGILVVVTTARPVSGAAEATNVPAVEETPGPGEPTLAEVRRATERFRDVNIALAEGYLRDPGNMCETADMMGQPASMGAMGIHYFRPDLLGITSAEPRVDGVGTHTDFRLPSILIYEPQADGSMELVAVENLVFAKAWHEAGNAAPPTFFGRTYETMRDDPNTATDEAHGFQPHYDRHVWLYRENVNGVFTPFNPAVTCAHHTTPHQQHAMHHD
jgi:hypothetical protein